MFFFRFRKLDFRNKKRTFCRLESTQTTIFEALGRFSAITSVSNQGRIGVNFGAFLALGRTRSRISKKCPSATNIVVWALSSTLERPENSCFLTLSRTRFLVESGVQGAETPIYKAPGRLRKLASNFQGRFLRSEKTIKNQPKSPKAL